MRPYLWNRTRKPRLVPCFRSRKARCPRLAGGGTLAAARVLARCVLTLGCPVLRVHCSFGLARHIGQRTDRMCRSVRCSMATFPLFDAARRINGQLCSVGSSRRRRGTESGIDGDCDLKHPRLAVTSMPLFAEHSQNRIVPARISFHSLADKGASLGTGGSLVPDWSFASRLWAGFTFNTK